LLLLGFAEADAWFFPVLVVVRVPVVVLFPVRVFLFRRAFLCRLASGVFLMAVPLVG
jgi:hypothetical protein